jgi:ABC-type branched-subunit amino acid transport system ATPase component
MSDKLLSITGLSAGYGPLRVLHEIDFSVAAGERLAIVGLNGHGKTTLFRAIMHLVGWQRGSVVFDGVEIGGTRSLGEGRRTPGIVRLGVAMTPQGDAIFPGLTVKQHLDAPIPRRRGAIARCAATTSTTFFRNSRRLSRPMSASSLAGNDAWCRSGVR